MPGPENRDGSGSGRDFFDTFCCSGMQNSRWKWICLHVFLKKNDFKNLNFASLLGTCNLSKNTNIIFCVVWEKINVILMHTMHAKSQDTD